MIPSEVTQAPPCVIHEDEHLLVVNKPAGWNTHAPSPYAGEGIYDWLRHREPCWASLAIIHRLDKETSGVLVFAKTTLANRSLTEQFTSRTVRKRYVMLTDRTVPNRNLRVESAISRAGERYISRPLAPGAESAVTCFRQCSLQTGEGNRALIAEPLTGRTHQIRVHAAASGFPILGDSLYGGTAHPRLCLHAESIAFRHPATGAEARFSALADFAAATREALRRAIIDPTATDSCRMIHGAADGWPGWYVERLGDFVLAQAETPLLDPQRRDLESLLLKKDGVHKPPLGIYCKRLSRQVRQTAVSEASPQFVFGQAAPERFVIRESGVRFEMSFGEGYSSGLFLDQRDNRRRFLVNHIAAGFELFPTESPASRREVLNTFAYTCGFSVCAALAGARTTSLDLSKKYLEWGRRNFTLNGLDPNAHDFIFGDVFDWMRRLAKKGRAFDAIVLDPPTFSQSKVGGRFQAERGYGRLIELAVPLLKPDGVLFASTNAARLTPEEFLSAIRESIRARGRSIKQEHYFPQPPDFPITRDEPAYLKTVWMRVG